MKMGTSVGIDVLKKEAGCERILQQFQPEFLENRMREYITLREALTGRNAATIRRICHKWCGICTPYGFETLGILARQIEDRTAVKDWGAVERSLKDVAVYLKHKKEMFENEGRAKV